MLEAENEDRKQIADRTASFLGYPAGAEAAVTTRPLEFLANGSCFKSRDVLEDPVLLHERQYS
jgi:hypothetical protein